jgi:hypothetical protein
MEEIVVPGEALEIVVVGDGSIRHASALIGQSARLVRPRSRIFPRI